jgi:capsular polysaccharide export protein
MIGYIYYLNNFIQIFRLKNFKGWGRKKTGHFAVWCYSKFGGDLTLLEDGFIRSIGLGKDESFSIIEDNIGMYYDATNPSRLEQILKEKKLKKYLEISKKAIELIKYQKISKYNNSSLTLPKYLQNDEDKVLIIAQTKGDMSLKYGYADTFDNKEMILKASQDNPNSKIYLKVHPDVIAGKKESNIDIEFAKKYCEIIDENIHPIVLLEVFDKVYTQTSQMGFEALLLGKEVHIFGAPFYVGWGVDNLKWHLDESLKKEIVKRRGKKLSIEEIFAGAYILYTKYYNPYKKERSNIIDVINTIDKYRNIYSQNEENLYFYGFSFWKRANTKKFFKSLSKNKIHFDKFIKNPKNAKIFIWGKKEFNKIEKFAKENNIPIFRVEDGFIRSVTLGSDLTKAYSLVIDSRGIYFDPTIESDLEWILNNYNFDEELIDRAEKLKEFLIEKKISKYNVYKDKKLNFNTNKKIVLVIGQVEDDASIKYGGDSMTNLELLQKVYKKRKNEYIIYKPHPDVLVGNRKGNIDKKEALKYAKEIITDISLPSIIEVSDEVHTITSLSGFEALIRGKEVYTYGMPFYADWGLTIDEKKCNRRKRKLSIEELISGTYTLYPRYISPKTGKFCEVEVLIKELEELKIRYNNDYIYKSLIDIRNTIFRKIQLIGRLFLEKDLNK